LGVGFAPTWLRQVSPPLLHMTTVKNPPRVGMAYTILDMVSA